MITDPSALNLALLRATQGVLSVLGTLHLTSSQYPPNYEVNDNENFDYIIIGGGTAGCVLAKRLTENPKWKVLVIEAGTDPQIETVLPGVFPLLTETSYDYNFPTVNDNYTAQNLRGNSVLITAGKMLGGSSGLAHLMHIRGIPNDYSRWAAAANDKSWDYESMFPYFKKSENVLDKAIRNSPLAKYHGFSGNLKVTREPNKNNKNIIDAFKDVGSDYNIDINSDKTLGVTEPFLYIHDGTRTSTAEAYLSPIRNEKNLFVWKKATVTKILFDKDNNANGVAVMNSQKKCIIVKASKEVIVSAGAIKSPQLLMLSGIGNKSHLEKFNISVISDLPVGDNLQDHTGAIILYKLKKYGLSNKEAPLNPFQFPAPLTVVNKALDPSQPFADYQLLNIYLPHDAHYRLLQVCTSTFKYNNKICNEFDGGIQGREVLYSVLTKYRPLSTGTVRLKTVDPLSDPLITTGYFSDPQDLDDLASYFLDYSRIVNSTYFKNVGAEFLVLNLPECNKLPKDSKDYWRCYVLKMSTTLWHFCGTNPLGTVLDSKLRVRGVQRLRVVDASSMPSITSGNIMWSVVALAEKAADLIKEDL